jgi:hypothetical protein
MLLLLLLLLLWWRLQVRCRSDFLEQEWTREHQ